MKSVTHTKSFEMAVPVEELFPLFSPEGEKKWVPDWSYDNIMGTTELSEDYVFLTKNHDHKAADAIWIVKTYDPESHVVQYYRIEPEDKIGVVTVECTALDSGRTRVQVTYKYTALSPIGETFIADFDENAYDEYIKEWQLLLKQHFRPAG